MPFTGNCLFLEILKNVGEAVRVALQKVAVKPRESCEVRN